MFRRLQTSLEWKYLIWNLVKQLAMAIILLFATVVVIFFVTYYQEIQLINNRLNNIETSVIQYYVTQSPTYFNEIDSAMRPGEKIRIIRNDTQQEIYYRSYLYGNDADARNNDRVVTLEKSELQDFQYNSVETLKLFTFTITKQTPTILEVVGTMETPSGLGFDIELYVNLSRTVGQQVDLIASVLFSILLVFTFFSFMLDTYMFRQLSKPIFKMSKTMNKMTRTSDYTVRLPRRYNHDEIDQLAESFNVLMDKVAKNADLQKQFLADVSHELKTPIAILQGYVEIMERHQDKLDESFMEEYFEVSKGELKRMRNMVQELLNISRLEFEDVKNAPEIDVTESFKQVVRSFQFVRDDVELTILHEDQATYCIMPDHFERLLKIFIDNAIKYSPETKKVDVSLEKNETQIIVSIRDYGVGISAEDLPNIFERFYRVDKARTSSGSYGLGLAIAKNIISKYQATIDVESEVDKGTKFVIYFPIEKTNQKQQIKTKLTI
ncbi:MAG: ATP-binding protein [Culicoidibacterales bacterium]